MADKDSKWPKTETAITIKNQNSENLCETFNSVEWKFLNKARFFIVKFYKPEDDIF